MDKKLIFGNKFKTLMAADFIIANIMMLMNLLFKKLSDYAKGFVCGIQFICLGVWIAWLAVCAANHRSPFIEKDE